MPADQRVDLCVLCHGLKGSVADWKTWLEFLRVECPTWVVKNCESVTKGSIPVIGLGLDTLSELLADEVSQAIAELQSDGTNTQITLHCIGHSMGGVILRGAMPSILERSPRVQAGVFMSLSSPHLGVQASWGAPKDMWRNLSFVLRPFSPQIPQLAVQDQSEPGGRPYFLRISDPEGPHMEALKKFQKRISVTMSCNDVVIPAASGSLWADRAWREPLIPNEQASGWGFEGVSTHTPDNSKARTRSYSSSLEKHRCCFRCARDENWVDSTDGRAMFPRDILDGLLTVSWERIVVRLHSPGATTHVFLLGKDIEQNIVEHAMSKECISHIGNAFLKAVSGAEIVLEAPCWISSYAHESPLPCEKSVCFGKWTVATEEGTDNVKFYAFDQQREAEVYFEGLGRGSAFSLQSRILFDPEANEVSRAGMNSGSFPTIHKSFAPSDSCPSDDCWIVGAERGMFNVRWYYFESETLARSFVAKGFHCEARILFAPDGSEVLRMGWNSLAQNTVARAYLKSFPKCAARQVESR